MSAKAEPVGGKLLTRPILVLVVFWALGTAAGIVRFTQGLGAVSAMNDGYPWGIWIAVDMVAGTALGSGGFAVALLVYVMNRGKLHPLIRPAILTSALGYSAGATAIVFDVGRWWNLWRVPVVPLFSKGGRFGFNFDSGLLEVALCVMAYTVVLWIELSPPILEHWRDAAGPRQGLAALLLPTVEKILPVVLALGLVLPLMHQSSLGSLFLVAVTKLHKLWHTPLLPFLFLLTCLGMGYGAVVLESVFSNTAFGRPVEASLLGKLTGTMAIVSGTFFVVRLLDVALRGRLGLAFAADYRALLFWVEMALAAAAAVMLWRQRGSRDAGALVRAAGVLAAAGFVYRVDVYLAAFDPGNGWRYFPSIGEILITLGIIAVETIVYVLIVRKFPILAGRRPVRAPDRAGSALAS